MRAKVLASVKDEDRDDAFKETNGLLPSAADLDLERAEETRAAIFSVKCTAMLLAYNGLFGFIFQYLESENKAGAWTYIDGWYFGILTIGTVGYGVLVPSNDHTRAAVMIYLAFGLTFCMYTMGMVCEVFLDSFERSLGETGLHEKKWVFFNKRAFGMIVVVLLIILIGVLYGVYVEEWSLIVSMYWVTATMTTVGYGDFAPTTQQNRLWTSFYILICAGLFAAVLAVIIASYLAVQKRARAVRFLLSSLSLKRLTHLSESTTNGEISRTTFTQFMLVSMGYVEENVLQLIDDAFDKLDTDGRGVLTFNNLGAEADGARLTMLAELREQHGIDPDDEDQTPFGFLGMRRQKGDGLSFGF